METDWRELVILTDGDASGRIQSKLTYPQIMPTSDRPDTDGLIF